VATVMGRYWAMDRDNRWDRTELAYRAMVYGEGIPVQTPLQAIEEAYAASETDEFVKPRVMVDELGQPVAKSEDGDAIIFFNFRADRVRQISRALGASSFDRFDRGPDAPSVNIVTMTQYDKEFPVDVAFPPQDMANILANVLERAGMTSFRTAETEKYP